MLCTWGTPMADLADKLDSDVKDPDAERAVATLKSPQS
jgi:hypothetical protein